MEDIIYIEKEPFEFSINDLTKVLRATPVIVKNTFESLTSETKNRNTQRDLLNFNEGKDTWSAFQVVEHLILADNVLWMERVKMILSSNQEEKQFKPFNRFAHLDSTTEKSILELCDEFSILRNNNIDILESWKLTNESLSREGYHPEFGRVTLRQLLTTWMVHDWGHQIQIIRVLAKQFEKTIGPWIKYISLFQR